MRRNRSDGPLNGRTAGRIVAILLLWSGGATVRLIAQTVPADAAQNAGGLFLLFPVGARAVGMGQSAAALDGSGEAAFWNPSGLATMTNDEFALPAPSLDSGPPKRPPALFRG